MHNKEICTLACLCAWLYMLEKELSDAFYMLSAAPKTCQQVVCSSLVGSSLFSWRIQTMQVKITCSEMKSDNPIKKYDHSYDQALVLVMHAMTFINHITLVL